MISRKIGMVESVLIFDIVVIAHFTVWKLRNFSLTEEIFREINSLGTSLVQTFLSRNFCQKCVRENLCT